VTLRAAKSSTIPLRIELHGGESNLPVTNAPEPDADSWPGKVHGWSCEFRAFARDD
jgi:hypothetical protein